MASSGIVLCCIVVAFVFPQAGSVQVVDQASAIQTVVKTDPTTSWITDREETICFQGETDYVKDVLRRLVESNLQIGYQDSKVMPGECNTTAAGFTKQAPWGLDEDGDNYWKKKWMQKCFPGLFLWLDGNPENKDWKFYMQVVDYMNINYIAEYNELHPDQANQTEATTKCDE